MASLTELRHGDSGERRLLSIILSNFSVASSRGHPDGAHVRHGDYAAGRFTSGWPTIWKELSQRVPLSLPSILRASMIDSFRLGYLGRCNVALMRGNRSGRRQNSDKIDTRKN